MKELNALGSLVSTGAVASRRDERLKRARAALHSVEARMGATRSPAIAESLPLTPAIAALLPSGVRPGSVVRVEGSTALMLEVAVENSRRGAWTALMGMPTVGVLAAARRGIDLSRVALVPHPGIHAPQAVGAAIEGMEMVLVGSAVALSDADRRRLAARAKERSVVIVAAGPWGQAQATLRVEHSQWRGLGDGQGRLRERSLTVLVSTKHDARPRRVQVVLEHDHAWGLRSSRQAVNEEVA